MIALVDFGAGNIGSISNALAALGAPWRVTRDPAHIEAARTVIFPGVGAFGAAMERLATGGLAEPLRRAAQRSLAGDGPFFFGICIGMQVLFEESDENPSTAGLGLFPDRVQRLEAPKVPHMGWNTLDGCAPDTVLADLDGAHAYFVHSFAPRACTAVAAYTTHGATRFVSAVARGRLLATQFHPEKSGPVGLAVLRRFLEAAR